MIWRKALRENWWKAAAVLFIMEVNLYLSIIFYPDVKKNYERIIEIFSLPIIRNILQVAGAEGFPGYILIQHFFKAINVLGCVAVVLLGMGIVAKEIENNTIQILLSRPVSRFNILTAAFVTSCLLIAGAVFIASCSAVFMGGLIQEELSWQLMLLGSVHSSIFLIFVFSLTTLISAISFEQTKVAFTAAGFLVFMFLIYFVQALHPYSLYQLNDLTIYLKINRGEGMSMNIIYSMLGAIGVFYTLAFVAFKKRNF